MRVSEMQDLVGRYVRLVRPIPAKTDGMASRPEFPVGSIGEIRYFNSEDETFSIQFVDTRHGVSDVPESYFDIFPVSFTHV